MTEPVEYSEAQLEALVVERHLAGLPPNKIAEELGIKVTEVKRLIKVAITARVPTSDLSDQQRTELARLDTMLFALWPRASNGTWEAIDRVLAIMERRERIANPKRNTHVLRKSFDEAVATSTEVKSVDVGVIELGRQYCDAIDQAMAFSKGEELTKALYLGPHVLGVLKELLATPAAREAAGKNEVATVGRKLAVLQAGIKRPQSA